jgi:hypothetical protein
MLLRRQACKSAFYTAPKAFQAIQRMPPDAIDLIVSHGLNTSRLQAAEIL